jgi:hypothetical protein
VSALEDDAVDHSKAYNRTTTGSARERQIEAYRETIAERLVYHKLRIDAGLDPRCGLRLMTPDSASVVPDVSQAGVTPFAQFSLDSRDAELYAIAHQAARDLVAYAEPAQ